MKALLIKKGVIEPVELSDDMTDQGKSIHDLIGNYFCSCFHVAGVGTGNTIMGFCDDEGLIHDTFPDFNVVPDFNLRSDNQPIAGPIVIVGVTEEGDNRELTEVEMEMFTIDKTNVMIIIGPSNLYDVPSLAFNRLAQ